MRTVTSTPGADVMRPALLLLAAVAAPAVAQTRTDFSFRRELAAGARLHLANVIGDVRIESSGSRTLEVAAVKRAGRHGEPEDVEIRAIDLADGVAICVIYPANRRAWDTGRPARRSDRDPRDDHREEDPCDRSSRWDGQERNDTEVDFTVRLPEGLRLTARTVSGDVVAENLRGDLELASVSGSVRLAGGEGPRIALTTVSGDVELLRVRARNVEGHAVSGRIRFEGPVQDQGSYDFATTSGDITVIVPERPNATLQAATFSGRFSSSFPTTTGEARRVRRSRHSAVWGNGSARLDVESLSGDISIRTAQP